MFILPPLGRPAPSWPKGSGGKNALKLGERRIRLISICLSKAVSDIILVDLSGLHLAR